MTTRRVAAASWLLGFVMVTSCGAPQDESVSLKPESAPNTQSEESTLGLAVDSFTKDNWIYTDSEGNVPSNPKGWPVKPHRPAEYDTFMGALRKLAVGASKPRNCTGIVVSEPTAAGSRTYNIFILTAAHCFEDANPLGFMPEKISTLQSVEATAFRPKVSRESFSSNRYYREFFQDFITREKFETQNLERSIGGDLARLRIAAGVSEDEVKRRSAVPLCSREYSSYEPALVERSGNRFRALIGRDSKTQKINIKRMYSGASSANDVGVYNRNPNVTNFLNSWAKEYNRGGSLTEFYSWTAGKAMELDAGDSGTPVIEGQQTGSILEFGPTVSKFECVSGVVTRSHWEMLSGRVGDTANGVNTAIIQRVWMNAQGFWEKVTR